MVISNRVHTYYGKRLVPLQYWPISSTTAQIAWKNEHRHKLLWGMCLIFLIVLIIGGIIDKVLSVFITRYIT